MSKYIDMINKTNKTLTQKNELLVVENMQLRESQSSLKLEINRLREEIRILERQKCNHYRRCESLERTLGSSLAMFMPLVTAMSEKY